MYLYVENTRGWETKLLHDEQLLGRPASASVGNNPADQECFCASKITYSLT
jgi:hypothetical protein